MSSIKLYPGLPGRSGESILFLDRAVYIREIIKLIFIMSLPLLFIRCGDPSVDVSKVSYKPKITVEAYLYANEPIKDIKIMKNYPLGTKVDFSKLYLTPEDNSVQAMINGIPLRFDPQTKTYCDLNTVVEYGKTYSLSVSAVVDGNKLTTEAGTTVPQTGFELLNKKNLGDFKYQDKNIVFNFKTCPGSDIYVFSFFANEASPENFIYDNIYFTGVDSNDVVNDMKDYRYQWDSMTDLGPASDNVFSYRVQPYMTWFYTKFKTTIYAGDKNFRDFLYTASFLQEPDGNFHEPVLIFRGDGIGVFASAVRDTVIFNIVE